MMYRMIAITTVTAGPAAAIKNSSRGSSGICSSCATPPSGHNRIARVLTPKCAAVSACPSSWRTTEPNTASAGDATPDHAARPISDCLVLRVLGDPGKR